MTTKSPRRPMDGDQRRRLVSVSVLLEHPRVKWLVDEFARPLVLDAIHATLADLRTHLEQPDSEAPALDLVLSRVETSVRQNQSARIRSVVNATGIILHTGLGRAVLPQSAVDALARLNRCCNLQIDLETGLRGKRNSMCSQLLCKLTGAEAATIVNNNAAATFLILSALAPAKEVVISRGQLIEIGGSFRLPDCIHQSGARMVEVGTTNKTHLRDYEQALTSDTAIVLRVNPSNYRVVGFSQEVPIAELVTLKKKQSVLVIDDLGCGALVDLRQFGLPQEPTVQASLAAGADLVCFSGDKLIGGPQAGIILGKKELIDRIKKHPLSRMLRVGKLTDLALEQTLRLFLNPETLVNTNPTLRMLAAPADALKRDANALKTALDQAGTPFKARVLAGESATGGGSLPAVPIPTYVLALSLPQCSPDDLCRRLRQNEPPVIARIVDDEVHLDMRTLMEGDADLILQALKQPSVQTGLAHAQT